MKDDWIIIDVPPIDSEYYIVTYKDLSDLVDNCGRPCGIMTKKSKHTINGMFDGIYKVYKVYSTIATVYIYGPFTFRIIKLFIFKN